MVKVLLCDNVRVVLYNGTDFVYAVELNHPIVVVVISGVLIYICIHGGWTRGGYTVWVI